MTNLFPANRQIAYTASASAAFEKIVRRESLAGSRVLLPAYICQDGFRPIFEEYNIEPRFVDVDRQTQHIDVDAAKNQLGTVDAVLLVHSFGLPAPVDALVDQARREDVVVVEDCARALGARVDGDLVGTRGDYAIYSFSKVSPLYTGGCLVYGPASEPVTLDAQTVSLDLLVKTLYRWSNRQIPYETQFVSLFKRLVGNRGYSVSGTERELAASGERRQSESVRRIDPLTRWLFEHVVRRTFSETLEERRSLANDLRETLREQPVSVQPDARGRVDHVLFATVPSERDEFVAHLTARGHTTHSLWKRPWGPSHADEGEYPVSQYLAAHSVAFPISQMSRADCRKLQADVRAFFGRGMP